MPKDPATRKVPRGAQRRKQLIDVAEQMLLERGFPDTTMQMIAEAAGASKETLYRHFESKELLFAEIISRKAHQISGPDTPMARGGSPETVLTELGVNLLRTIVTGEASFLFRTVVAEAARTPELGDLFYQRGPGLTVERLTQYLAEASARGELHCDDPTLAARLFLGAVVSQFHLRRLFQSTWKSPTEKEIGRHVKAAVSMFLAQFGPR
ncbi:MAG: TetR/AcrR family transcriptional regulator [Bradyrhizobium sp.]|uniref:TetR/AcrR family transcriptional regulator n=1 Tax=Bradyrhizobium sp. TaxID=376 RepID=UPI003C6B4D64